MGMKRRQNGMLLFYVVLYLSAIGFSKTGQHIASGLLLLLAAVGMYGHEYQKTGLVVNAPGLLSLSWIGGQALASLKLSALQREWSWTTWCCFFLFHVCFLVGYAWLDKRETSSFRKAPVKVQQIIFGGILLVTAMSLGCFLLEAAVLGYIPMFVNREIPHAYSEFHISGVHYFTVSCALVMPFTALYIVVRGIRETLSDQRCLAVLVICNVIALSIPMLCISRQQMLMSFGVSAILLLRHYHGVSLKKIMKLSAVPLLMLAAAYLALTFFRGFGAAEMNEMCEMKNKNMPLLVTQVYMYIANNYENFDFMVEQLPGFTWGVRQLFPVWAFSGLKFVFPELVQFPLYTIKYILSTVTVIYDAYYDFGIPGVAGFGVVLGMVSSWLNRLTARGRNPVALLLYAEVVLYLVLSFFTTWFSNPTIWFWIGVTAVLYWAVGFVIRREECHE